MSLTGPVSESLRSVSRVAAGTVSLVSVCVVCLVGPTDCIVEGEVLKLGGPFLQTWQKKHLKLYPNRLEFYPKSRDGQIVKGKGVEVHCFSALI